MMELTTSMLLLANTLTAMSAMPMSQTPAAAVVSDADNAKTLVVAMPQSFQEYVRDYYSDVPVLAEIAKCESTFRQYDKDGIILRGVVNTYDVGVMQINELYHLKRAEKLGYDIYSTDGNLAYARFLYGKEGTRPWQSSSKCWGQTAANKDLAKN